MGIKKESIGLFVIGGLVLFGIGMFLIGDRHQLFARHTEYYTEFTNLSGLTTGAKVRVSGLDAGEVLTIDVPDPRRAVPPQVSNRRAAACPCPERFRRHDWQGGGRRRHLPVGSTGAAKRRKRTALATIPERGAD